MKYLARIYRYRGEYSAEIPDLPGCVAAARSVEECRRLLAKAARLHLDMMRRSGERIPRSSKLLKGEPDPDGAEAYCTWIELPPKELRKVPVSAR